VIGGEGVVQLAGQWDWHIHPELQADKEKRRAERDPEEALKCDVEMPKSGRDIMNLGISSSHLSTSSGSRSAWRFSLSV
jgi:hypothetical protein